MRLALRRWRPLAVALTLILTPFATVESQPRRPTRPPSQAPWQDSLATFLRDWIARERASNERLDYLDESPTRYLAARIVSPDRRHAGFVVHLVGRAWCADDAAGCTTLVVAREAGAFRVIGNNNNTHLPVSVLPETSHGWPDVGVWVSGGGGPGRPHRARLRFDGRRYPGEAWAAPHARTVGRVVLSEALPWRRLELPASRTPSR